MRCAVVGAGVIGLSCAWRLREAGHDVRLVTDLEPGGTTSAVAAAIWYPYLAAPRERVVAWGARTYDVLADLASRDPSAGIRLLPGVEVFGSAQPDPWWAGAVPDLRRLSTGERPDGFPDGWAFTTPVVDMPVYLAWLCGRLATRGVGIERRHVADLDDELSEVDVVINCTGLGSRDLVGDRQLEPVRGQVVVMTNPGVSSWWLHDAGPGELTYVVPRLETLVVGGTAEPGADDLTPDPRAAAAILARATELVPAIARADVLAHRVGLRPVRPEIRLEPEHRPGGGIVHCYGHGGAGVTLSWGCADDVVELVGRLSRAGATLATLRPSRGRAPR